MIRFLVALLFLSSTLRASPLLKYSPVYDAETCGCGLNLNATKPETMDEVDEAMDQDSYEYEQDDVATLAPGDVPKAMGGVNAAEGQVPWAVAIMYKTEYRCTGTLISKKHMITAAHCFVRNTDLKIKDCGPDDYLTHQEVVDHMTIHYGGTCLNPQHEDCEGRNDLKSVRVVRAQFTDFFVLSKCKGGRDYALIELEREVEVNHICLPHLHNSVGLRDSPLFKAYGWGTDPIRDHLISPVLQNVGMGYLLGDDYCRRSWTEMPFDGICVLEYNDKDLCKGDSGGGIYTTDQSGRSFLYGVVSFGTDCNRLYHENLHGRSQVFTDITHYSATIDRFIFGERVFNHIRWW